MTDQLTADRQTDQQTAYRNFEDQSENIIIVNFMLYNLLV